MITALVITSILIYIYILSAIDRKEIISKYLEYVREHGVERREDGVIVLEEMTVEEEKEIENKEWSNFKSQMKS